MQTLRSPCLPYNIRRLRLKQAWDSGQNHSLRLKKSQHRYTDLHSIRHYIASKMPVTVISSKPVETARGNFRFIGALCWAINLFIVN